MMKQYNAAFTYSSWGVAYLASWSCRWQFTGALRMVVLVFYKLMLMRMWERQCLMPVVVNVNLTIWFI